MDKGLPWYKRDPRAMVDAKRAANNGQGMTIRQAAIYDVVIDLIYEGGGETPNTPQHFASHFKDMGTRGARQAVEELSQMGKLTIIDGMIHNRRAENQAQKRLNLSKKRAEAGAVGGAKSAITRRNLSENSSETDSYRGVSDDIPSGFQPHSEELSEGKSNDFNGPTQANAKAKAEAKGPKDKIKREIEIGGGSDEPTERELLLVAMGHDASGMTASGRLVGNQGDMMVFNQWRSDLGLSWDEIVGVIREVRSGPSYPPQAPFSFKFFNSPMQRLAGQKQAPALTPEEGNPNGGYSKNQAAKGPRQGDRGIASRVNRLRGASLVPDSGAPDE
ncbi:hypothetical protein [uncultured Planktomarina sp.]|uniref:hypothetical protein n=1 Tax=uncultured Planktomarina sp. TaxID=1538529 RepID=UPI00325FF954